MRKEATISATKVHKLTKFAGGASYGLILPIEFIRHLGWRERQKLNITLDGKKLIIEDWQE